MLKLSPDEAALLKAVCADRNSDLPRLVYADWCDDHGRPERAEFIRLQVQAEQQPGEHTRYHLWPRIDELLAAHRDRWVRELPKWADAGSRPFVRGFIERLDFPAGQFLYYGPQLLDRTPVRGLRLRACGRMVEDLVRCPWLREVPDIDLSSEQMGGESIPWLASAEWLVGTRRLSLAGNGLRDPAARALAGCAQLRRLELLDLSDNAITRAGVERLLGSPHLRHCHFRLAGNQHLLHDYHAVRRLLGPRGTL